MDIAGIATEKRRTLPKVSARHLGIFMILVTLGGCSMGEEVKRIEQTRQAQIRQEQGASTDLSGEQVFIRSCNTCHPGGRKGFGPSLENLNEQFPDDKKLKAFLREGKGIMPPQPKAVINDKEMDNLVTYLRNLNVKP